MLHFLLAHVLSPLLVLQDDPDLSSDELFAEHVKGCFVDQDQLNLAHCRLLKSSRSQGVYPPAAVVVRSHKMYIAWRGTDSVMDVLTDTNCRPIVGYWTEMMPEILAHTGMNGMLQTFMTEQIRAIQDIVDKFQVDKIICSGHSLGGGIAQIALLSMYGLRQSKFTQLENVTGKVYSTPLYQTFKKVELCAIVFAAPMVFHVPESPSDMTTRFLESFLEFNCINFVFDNDLVPRMPGHVEFIKEALTDIAKDEINKQFKNVFVGVVSSYVMFAVQRSIVNKAAKIIGSIHDSLADDMRMYRHTSTIIHFDYKDKNGEVSVKASRDTPKAFGEKSAQFHVSVGGKMVPPSNSVKHLLEYHSVCPSCLGSHIKDEQTRIQEIMRNRASLPNADAEFVGGKQTGYVAAAADVDK